MATQSVLDQYNASLRQAGLPYSATVGPGNKVVFADGPYAGQEIGLPNFNHTTNGGQDVRTITGPDAQHLTGTAIAGPDQGQTVNMSQMPWWKEALIGGAFAAAPFALGSLGVFGGGGGAAAGAAPAVAAGGQDAGDAAFAADGLAGGGATAGTVPLATSVVGDGTAAATAAASPYAHLITSGLISAGTAVAKGLIQSNATSKAVQAETQAALPYSIGGNAAWQQQLAQYGITLPASATGGVGPNGMPTGAAAPTGAPMGPSAPAQGQPAPVLTTAPTLPQGYTLASMMAPQNPNLPPPTASAFGGR